MGQRRQPQLAIQVSGSSGVPEPMGFLLDTGYNGWLTLPAEVIARLGLSPRDTRTVNLADGQDVDVSTFIATVIWHGEPHPAYVVESPGDPLLGMSMLWGSEVTLQAWEGGGVIIEEVDPREPIS